MNRKILIILFAVAAVIVIGLTVFFTLRDPAPEDAVPVETPSVYDMNAVYINGKAMTLEELKPYFSLSVNNLMSELDIDEPDWNTVFLDTGISDYVKKDALEILRLYAAIEKKAAELKTTLSDEELKKLDSWHKDAVSKLGSEEAYETYLLENRMTEAAYKHIYAVNLLYKHLYDYYYGEEGAAVPTQEETDAWGDANKLYHIKHIFLATQDNEGNPIDADDKELQLALAKNLEKRIMEGEDFDRLSIEYSSDGGLKNEYLFLDEAEETFRDALSALEVGSVSGIIESDYGYHILKREPLDVRYVLDNYPQIVTDSFNELISQWTKDVEIHTTDVFDGFDVSVLYIEK
ncbi:MAG: hypothetical protein GXX89_03755 [Clostridiales bacterium]|jgi:hypothetical protein|nr:hypothetical protein [Clostridiales bacterium]